MEKVIKTFGTWKVTENGIDSDPYYDLSVRELFVTDVKDGITVWHFPIHMTSKTWMMGSEFYRLEEFNEAFKFAQDYFKAYRPADTATVSEVYTWELHQEFVALKHR